MADDVDERVLLGTKMFRLEGRAVSIRPAGAILDSRQERVLCRLKRLDGHLPGNGRELLRELVERVTRFQVIAQVLKWHASAAKNA